MRHFNKKNAQHPTYKPFAELGKAIKTIFFMCLYLHDEALRREINEELNVFVQWNGATDFVIFARLVSQQGSSNDHAGIMQR